MEWIRVDKVMPKPAALVLGVIREGDNRRAVRPVRWITGEWQYDRTSTVVSLYGHRITHWMPLPEPPADGE